MLTSSINIDKILNRINIENEIKTLLKNFEKNIENINYKKGIYLYGSPGCGKTFFIKRILKELNYDIIHYDAGDIRNKLLIESITSNNISNKNVLTMMKKQKQNIVIIMDEIDGMNNGDKGSINALIKLIRQKKTKKQKMEDKTTIPIICIGNYYVDKKIKELMKVCNVFELKSPTDEQISQILKVELNDLNAVQMNILLKYIQGDLRKLEFILKMYNKTPELITTDKIHNIFHLKSFNDDSKKITKKIIENPYSMREHTYCMNETDRTIVALLWHENIIDVIENIDYKHAHPLYLSILNNICFADYIDRITFQNQIWQFNEMSSLLKTFYNNKIYHDFLKTNNLKPKILNEVRFTKVLTKYSTEYNNTMFIYNLCNELDMDKKDLITFFQDMRIYGGGAKLLQNAENILNLEKKIGNPNINSLDIKRFYRYIDKNVKKIFNNNEDDEDI